MTKKLPPSTACTPEAVLLACADAGFSLHAKTASSLALYLEMLGKWNRVMNLVGPARWEDILRTLIIDSLHLAGFIATLPLPDAPACRDLGAGAGLPGIPLRMLWQQGSYTLVEARKKRALFLRAVLSSCPLPGVSVFHGRAEEFMATRPPADLTVSRAFLPWEKVLDMIENHTSAGGSCIFLTLAPAPATLPDGWTLAATQAYRVGQNSRYFWALRKN